MSPKSILGIRLKWLNIHLLVWNWQGQCNSSGSKAFEPPMFESPILEFGDFIHVFLKGGALSIPNVRSILRVGFFLSLFQLF